VAVIESLALTNSLAVRKIIKLATAATLMAAVKPVATTVVVVTVVIINTLILSPATISIKPFVTGLSILRTHTSINKSFVNTL
jgi:hypothetical protein